MHAKTDLLLTHIRRGTEEYRTQIVAEACFLPIGTREGGDDIIASLTILHSASTCH